MLTWRLNLFHLLGSTDAVGVVLVLSLSMTPASLILWALLAATPVLGARVVDLSKMHKLSAKMSSGLGLPMWVPFADERNEVDWARGRAVAAGQVSWRDKLALHASHRRKRHNQHVDLSGVVRGLGGSGDDDDASDDTVRAAARKRLRLTALGTDDDGTKLR